MKAKRFTKRFASTDVLSMREFKKWLDTRKMKCITYKEVDEFYDWETHVTMNNVNVGILEINIYYKGFRSIILIRLLMALYGLKLRAIMKSNRK